MCTRKSKLLDKDINKCDYTTRVKINEIQVQSHRTRNIYISKSYFEKYDFNIS